MRGKRKESRKKSNYYRAQTDRKEGDPLQKMGERFKLQKQQCHSVHSSQKGSREPYHEVLPADVTAHETQPLPVTIKLPSPGAAHGHSLEREVLQPEYQARWVLGLSWHACFDVIAAA